MIKAEKEYDTTNRDFLAVVWDVRMLRPYSGGVWFTTWTDHDELRWILNMADATGKLSQWHSSLSEIAFGVVDRARIRRQAADAFYRLISTDLDISEVNCDLLKLT